MRSTALALAAVVTLLAPVLGQGERLQRAILIEEQEHNLEAAVKLYEEIAKADGTSAAEWLLSARG